MTQETLTEQAFERVADEALRELEGALGDLDGVEVSLQMGILTLEFPDGARYVVNSHRAARQIWMAAERNAWHFDYQAGHDGGPSEGPPNPPVQCRWVAAKNGDELWSTIAAVTARKLGHAVDLGKASASP
jgi:CyaY protein